MSLQEQNQPMRTLYHFPLSPHCRKIRLVMGEKGLPFELITEPLWEKRARFLALNPAGEVPVLVDENGIVAPDSNVIAEYLDEAYPEVLLFGRTLAERVEVRRVTAWFDKKFDQEVSRNILGEKYLKRLLHKGNPDSNAIRQGYACLKPHMDYLAWLADSRKWLAGDFLSLADLTAASYISSLDYINEINWDQLPVVHDWYARIKCRPAFRPLLQDRVIGLHPPPHYTDLDF